MDKEKFERYKTGEATIPNNTVAWNMYGPGIENIGRDGYPETFPVPEPGPDQREPAPLGGAWRREAVAC